VFFLIGHRGVGKTTLLNEIDGAVDLDAEISKNTDINSFFSEDNEQGFRKKERSCLKRIIAEGETSLVALGAGFQLDEFEFPENAIFIWIQRRSDLKGRVFLNRPRLDVSLTPLEEYFARFDQRQELYSRKADFCLELIEGAPLALAGSSLKLLMQGEKIESTKAFYTLESEKDLRFFSGAIELRTDSLDESSILSILQKQSQNSYLVSIRSKASANFVADVLEFKNCTVDLPLENREIVDLALSQHKNQGSIFLSCHRELSQEEWSFVESQGLHLKWAPKVEDFKCLKAALSKVQNKDVSFLPRDPTDQGRWKWLRESLFQKNKINFYRTGLNGYLDQVTLDELNVLEKCDGENKGAVLGEQIFLSRSPGFHEHFFKKTFKSFYSSIKMNRSEFNEDNLDLIKSFGYRFFSVTAPFKNQMSFLGAKESVNSLVLNEKENSFFDTDHFGLEAIVDKIEKNEKVLIWGSGSMGQALKSLLGDKAELLSVRDYGGSELSNFDVMIWCAGPDADAPNFEVLPLKIFDLEYKEQSKAKQIALELGTQYISGEHLFATQARAQQSFWLESVKEF